MPDYSRDTVEPASYHAPNASQRKGLSRLFGARIPVPAPSHAGLSYRYLARQVENDLPYAEGGRTILVSSPSGLQLSNESCLMFAYFLSNELGCRVLLADGTFGDGGVGSALGHAGAPGFMDLAYGADYPFAELIQPTRHSNVSVLPAGRTSVMHLLPMEQPRIADMFTRARGRFDYVLLQQGAIYEDSRYLRFAGSSDMVLLLIEEGGTPTGELERCTQVFRDHQIRNVRLLLSAPR